MEAAETSNNNNINSNDLRRDNNNVNRTEDDESAAAIDNESRISNLERNGSNLSLRSIGNPNRMTLQLVLPPQFGVVDDPQGYEANNNITRRSRPPSRQGSVLESKSPGFINTRLVNYNRGLSHQPSILSQRTEHSHKNHPPPSTEEEKSKMTRRYFATIFAISYAIFLVIFGAIAFVVDGVEDQRPIPQIFCIFMLSVGLCYFIFLYIDIRMHIMKAKKAVKERDEQMRIYQEQVMRVEENFQSSLEMTRQPNGNVNVQIPIPDLMMGRIKSISHRYCFQTGRHGEFLYLKFGAAWFCFGLLIHSVLSLMYQVTYFTMDSECQDVLQLTVDIMFPIWAIFILFFIFKYCNVIINSYRGVARVLIMHAIGTTLAFWILTIVRETVDAINLKDSYKANEVDPLMEVRRDYLTLRNYSSEIKPYQVTCPGPDDLNTIRRTISPYLYPFVIEFCILIVGIFYMMWANINHCPKKLSAKQHHGNHHGGGGHHGSNHASNTNLSVIHEEDHTKMINNSHSSSDSSDHCGTIDHDNQFKSSIVVYADCHASSRGLFAGLILLVVKIVFIILLHIAVSNEAYVDTGVLIDRSLELAVLVILIIAVVLAYVQTSKLDINPHPISKLDDVLLFIAIPAFFSETIFSMVPAIYNGSILNIFIIMAQLIQILLQTPWIIDALRRCTNSVELRKKKPGRELVTFLTVANVALWVYYTFTVKTGDTQDERYTFYGYVLWSILNHLSLPLIMFYRFHASVCLVDIWRHSYEPGEFAH